MRLAARWITDSSEEFGAESDDVGKRVEHENLVDIEVGDDGVLRNGRILGEIFGAEFASFFAGDGDEEDGAARAGIHARESLGDFENCCGAGCIVERPVVDGVAFDGFADAEMIEVRGVNEAFVFQDRVAAFEFSDHVGAVCVFGFGDGMNVGGYRKREGGEFSTLDAVKNFVDGVAGAFEKLARGGYAENCDTSYLRQVVIGMAFFVEPAETHVRHIVDIFGERILSFVYGIGDSDYADGAVVDSGFAFDFG